MATRVLDSRTRAWTLETEWALCTVESWTRRDWEFGESRAAEAHVTSEYFPTVGKDSGV